MSRDVTGPFFVCYLQFQTSDSWLAHACMYKNLLESLFKYNDSSFAAKVCVF